MGKNQIITAKRIPSKVTSAKLIKVSVSVTETCFARLPSEIILNGKYGEKPNNYSKEDTE